MFKKCEDCGYRFYDPCSECDTCREVERQTQEDVKNGNYDTLERNVDKFWMCLVEGSSGCRYQHYSWDDASTEAERLSKLPANRGKKVYITASMAFCVCPESPLEWHLIE